MGFKSTLIQIPPSLTFRTREPQKLNLLCKWLLSMLPKLTFAHFAEKLSTITEK